MRRQAYATMIEILSLLKDYLPNAFPDCSSTSITVAHFADSSSGISISSIASRSQSLSRSSEPRSAISLASGVTFFSSTSIPRTIMLSFSQRFGLSVAGRIGRRMLTSAVLVHAQGLTSCNKTTSAVSSSCCTANLLPSGDQWNSPILPDLKWVISCPGVPSRGCTQRLATPFP